MNIFVIKTQLGLEYIGEIETGDIHDLHDDITRQRYIVIHKPLDIIDSITSLSMADPLIMSNDTSITVRTNGILFAYIPKDDIAEYNRLAYEYYRSQTQAATSTSVVNAIADMRERLGMSDDGTKVLN